MEETEAEYLAQGQTLGSELDPFYTKARAFSPSLCFLSSLRGSLLHIHVPPGIYKAAEVICV